MGKKRRILVAVLIFAVFGGLAWMMLRPSLVEPEPVYQGKPLSAWLEDFDLAGANYSAQRFDAAKPAIREIGTDAIPAMLRMLRTPDLPWKNRLFAFAQKQHVIKINHVEPSRLYMRAFYGLEALGPRAVDAVPDLVKIYDQNPAAQSYIAMVLGSIGPDANAAVPSLLRGAGSTNSNLRNNSLAALWQIHAEPGLVVPVFINTLQDRDPAIRSWAVRGLGAFGTNSRTAVPALVKMIESKEPPVPTNYASYSFIKTEALQALKQIDPEAAAKVSTNVAEVK